MLRLWLDVQRCDPELTQRATIAAPLPIAWSYSRARLLNNVLALSWALQMARVSGITSYDSTVSWLTD